MPPPLLYVKVIIKVKEARRSILFPNHLIYNAYIALNYLDNLRTHIIIHIRRHIYSIITIGIHGYLQGPPPVTLALQL